MKRLQILKAIFPCLVLLSAAGIALAACVTPKEIADKSTEFVKAHAANYVDNDVKKRINFVHDLLAELSKPAAEGIAGSTVAEVVDALIKNKPNWQLRAVDSSNATKWSKDLQLLQTWANYGELVVLTTDKDVALVVPGKAETGVSGPWAGLPIPNIAYAGDPLVMNKHTVSANAKASDAQIDPTKIKAFRYRN